VSQRHSQKRDTAEAFLLSLDLHHSKRITLDCSLWVVGRNALFISEIDLLGFFPPFHFLSTFHSELLMLQHLRGALNTYRGDIRNRLV